MTQFNTAVFYDIENLIGGYQHADMLTALSLKEIYDELQTKLTGKIAIQRAYANWSDPRLSILRGDIVELGIEPIQMFGFGRGSQKNASDIQLAIDATEVAITKKEIEVFVIVSGDGGFSSLAKKLHEYGKAVIGCAYRKTTNKVFQAVCDEFVWIGIPSHINGENGCNSQISYDPIVIDFMKEHKPIAQADKNKVFQASKAIISFLSRNQRAHHLLSNNGLNISILSQLLNYRLKDFSYFQLGFVRFIDFIRFITYNTSVKLVLKPPSEYRLVYTFTNLQGYEPVPYIKTLGELHSVENYKVILERGVPVFRQFSQEILYSLAEHMAAHKVEFQNLSVGDIVERLSHALDFSQNEIKLGVMAFISAECFLREPQQAPLSEQKLFFIPKTAEEAMDRLLRAMENKLRNILEEIDAHIWAQVLS